MVKFRHLLAALFIYLSLAYVCAFAQSTFTQIRDVVTNSNGTPFNGMVVITWNGYSAPGGTPVSQLSASARIYNGALSVLLVPTTTATAGTYYQVVYTSSDGTVTWTETWQVPPSTTALTISQVRQSTTQGSGSGSSGGSGSGSGYATLPINISDVTNLSSDLSTINTSITTLNTEIAALGAPAITALTNTVNSLSSTVTGLTTTVSGNTTSLSTLTTTVTGLNATVTGLSTTVSGNSSSITTLNGSVSGITTNVSGLTTSVNTLNTEVATINATLGSMSSTAGGLSFIDAATPTGTVNGTNAAFTLSGTPYPAASLSVYRNGLLQAAGVDFTLAGTTVTFLGSSIPQVGDIVQTFFRVNASGPTVTFVDAETPGGSVNGTNLAFTLVYTPNPAASVKLYKNGLLMSQGNDYTISGSTITFAAGAVPVTGDALVAAYRH